MKTSGNTENAKSKGKTTSKTKAATNASKKKVITSSSAKACETKSPSNISINLSQNTYDEVFVHLNTFFKLFNEAIGAKLYETLVNIPTQDKTSSQGNLKLDNNDEVTKVLMKIQEDVSTLRTKVQTMSMDILDITEFLKNLPEEMLDLFSDNIDKGF